MLNPFDEPEDEASNDILEGFLCPICHEDLKSLQFLTEHFERSHSEEEDAIKNLFKDIFTKAKKKIKLNFDETFDVGKSGDKNAASNGHPNRSNLSTSGSGSSLRYNAQVIRAERQEVGAERSHFDYFKSVRDPRLERYASETNKLIIRLHKLLKDMPSDLVLRKQHEQQIVTWLDGHSVNLCPSCARNFHIARRQHHCRLCGSIMCNDCSKFLPLSTALELASLTMPTTEPLQQPQRNSSSNTQQSGIRSCEHCTWLLETRREMHESRSSRPLITQLYTEIQQLRKDVAPDIETYFKIVNSLYDGETVFTIADASALRGKIGQIAETIDTLSKRILKLSSEDGSREELLKKAIRLSCVQLIKEKMLSTPQLPAEDEIRKAQERRRTETEKRIEIERRQAMEAFERISLNDINLKRNSPNSTAESYTQISDIRSLDNWSAHQTSGTGIVLHDDPLVEQINIIKGYIKQARQEMNFDVVETLEINLRELQREFYERQTAMTMTPTAKSSKEIEDIAAAN